MGGDRFLGTNLFLLDEYLSDLFVVILLLYLKGIFQVGLGNDALFHQNLTYWFVTCIFSLGDKVFNAVHKLFDIAVAFRWVSCFK